MNDMARLTREFPWEQTPLGRADAWPPHLRASVDLMLAHGFPMIVLWGPELIQLYNDGYAIVLGDKHPGGLGLPTEVCWPEVWHINGPLYARVWQGETITFEDKLYPLARRGGELEDAWFTITYNPIRAADGGIDGVLVTMFETTAEHLARAERERAERQLRANEERFRQFADASSDVLWIRSAPNLNAELLSPAFEVMHGVSRAEMMGPLRHWAALVIPEDRNDVVAHLNLVREGHARSQEFRIQRRSDGVFRWVRDTAFPLHDAQGKVTRIAGISTDITEARRSAEHQQVLLAELQHRVRNLMAMMGAIVLRSQANAGSVEAYAERVSGRLMALSRTQTLLTRTDNQGSSVRPLVEAEFAAVPQAAGRFTLQGPDIVIAPKAVEVLTLALHELAVNAAVHGAFCHADGHVSVDWGLALNDGVPWLALRWQERHTPHPDWTPPQGRGFGSALVEQRIAYELEGSGVVAHHATGTVATLEFPLRGRESILQTDAPAQARTAGGELDLTGELQWQGRTVMVVDDDFYLAHDLASAVRTTGARVMGPFGHLADAMDALEDQRPDVAVVDINLGQGPTAELVQALHRTGIPLLIVTGYDGDALPSAASGHPCLRKPVRPREILRSLAQQSGTA